MYKRFLDHIRRTKIWATYRLARDVYHWRSSVLLPRRPIDKAKTFGHTLWRFAFKNKTILFYPDEPLNPFVIYKIVLYLGYRITANPSNRCDLAINWYNAMDGNPFIPPDPALAMLKRSRPSVTVLNVNCADVSKRRVNAVFEETFGYSLTIDPLTYTGKCVEKSNWNGLHVGHITECPTTQRKNDVVYQKLICNDAKGGLVEDIRVPVFGSTIPFVYLKYRPLDNRLVDRSHTNKKAVIAELKEVLSEKESGKILEFCRRMGLDYGEVDVLRDRHEGRIYIVDVNNNPFGPPEPISQSDANTAIVRLAQAFERAFAT